MAKLTFTGRSRDGKRLLLVDESGQEHTLAIDARLRRALTGAPDSNGQLEIPMESTLRPRDIQARIRAGESPEAVAHAAGTSVEKIMPFAAPVMAERAHVAERAQLASVRRRASESGARTLGEAVSAHLRSHNVDPTTIEWDAWRREDGRWTLTALYEVAGRVGTATFSHDPRGSFVTVDDDDARWLVGDAAPAAATSPAADDLAAARQRRLSAVDDDLPLGDDAIEMVTGEEAPASPEETTMELPASDLGAEQPVEAYLDERDARSSRGAAEPATGESSPSAEPRNGQQPDQQSEQQSDQQSDAAAAAAGEPRSRPARKRGRASVPSWDEIMFGGGKGD